VNAGNGACHLWSGEHGSHNPSKHANAFPVLRSILAGLLEDNFRSI
jgi:hypothetical protein